jgi:hypothetical protein
VALALRKEREALSQELHNPTPEQLADEEQYHLENPDLFARAEPGREQP